jgi:hypothetical protein
MSGRIDLEYGESCTMAELDAALKRAYRMPRDDDERADVLIAWAAGEISEGNAAKLLGMDRVSAREQLQAAIERGRARARRDVRAALKEAQP